VATLNVVLPIALTLVLLYGGGQVQQCLGGSACVVDPAAASPVLFPFVALALGIAWLVIATGSIAYLRFADTRRLWRAAGGSLALVVATSVVTAGSRVLDGQRLRVVAEDAGLYGLGALLVVAPIGIALALLTVRSASDRA
jgi:hypothetical protein